MKMPIFLKNKVFKVQDRSVLQLMSVISHNEKKDHVRTFTENVQTHSTLEEKKFIQYYAEHINFFVKRAGWLITKIYQQFTFAQKF